jgi:hypothetical protein
MDKYDELEESERNYRDEDYFYQIQVGLGIETREKQEAICWKKHRESKRKR